MLRHATLAATCVGALGLHLASASASSDAATSLMSSVVAAVNHQRSVQWVYVSTEVGGCTASSTELKVLIVADATTTAGALGVESEQQGATGEEGVLLLGGTAYLHADDAALRNWNCFSSSLASRIADQWVSIPASNSQFENLTEGLTIPSLARGLAMESPRLVPGTRKIDGEVTRVLESTVTMNSVRYTLKLYVRASGAPLPVERDVVSTPVHAVTLYKHWGESVQVTRPSRSIPFP